MIIPNNFNGAIFNNKTGLKPEQWHIEADGTIRAPISVTHDLLDSCVEDPTPARIQSFQALIEKSYQDIATSLDYKSPERMLGYIGCAVPQWDADGRAMQAHMANTAIAAYTILGKVQSGQILEPTEVEFLAMLPKFQQPQV